jgi:hypothetical protein
MLRAFNCFPWLLGPELREPDTQERQGHNQNRDSDNQAPARDPIEPKPAAPVEGCDPIEPIASVEGSLEKKAFLGELPPVVIPPTASADPPACPPATSQSQATSPRTNGPADSGAHVKEVGSAFVDANPPERLAGEVKVKAVPLATVVDKEDTPATADGKAATNMKSARKDKKMKKARGKENDESVPVKSAAVLAAEARTAANAAKKARKAAS